MPTHWRVYQDHTVAARLDRSELPGVLGKTAVAGPDEAVIVVRDGVPQAVLTEGTTRAADLLDQAKALVGAGADIAVYYASLAPFDITLFAGEQTTREATRSATAHVAVTAQAGVSTAATSRGGSASAAEASHLTRGREADRPREVGRLREWWLRQFGWREAASASQSSAGHADAGSDYHAGWNVRSAGASGEGNRAVSAAVSEASNVSRVCVLALSADREVVNASVRVRLRADPENLGGLTALLTGKRAVATWDIAALLRDEVLSGVLVPEVARHPAAALRGDRGLLARLEADARDRLAATLDTFGLVLEQFAVTWGLTDQERHDIAVRRAEREEAALRFAADRRLAQMAREQEIRKAHLANLHELKAAAAAGNEEQKKLLLAAALDRDLLTREHRVDVARVEARIREIDLEVEKSASLLRLEQRRADEELRLEVEDREFRQKHAARLLDIEAADKEMWSLVKMKAELAAQKHDQEMARRRQEIEADFRRTQADIEDRYQQRKLKLDESLARMGMVERLVGQGLSTGAADAGVLKTLLEQATEQEYATTTDEKVRARAAAQATGNSLDSYRAALADERVQQVSMTHLSAHLMAAAKQSPAPVVLPGVPAYPPTGHPAAGPAPAAPPGPQPADARAEAVCPNPGCGQAARPGWKTCPFCGTPLHPGGPVPGL